jgi:hypothetical protein
MFFQEILHIIRLPVVLSLLSQNQVLFCVGGWRPYCALKQCWTAVRDCSSANHNMHWNYTRGVDIITDLTRRHQLVHARNPGMKKQPSRVFLSDDKLDMCMIISFQNINFLFWIPFIWTPCICSVILAWTPIKCYDRISTVLEIQRGILQIFIKMDLITVMWTIFVQWQLMAHLTEVQKMCCPYPHMKAKCEAEF